MIYLEIHKKLVNIYPIGPAKGALNNPRSPKFNGSFKITEEHNTLKAKDFNIKKSNIKSSRKIDELFTILKKQKLLITKNNPLLERFLENYNLKYEVIMVCNRCIDDNLVTILNEKTSHKYNHNIICESCLDNIIREVLFENGHDTYSFKRFKNLYENTGDLGLVFDMIENEYDPIENSELTLYDKFEQTDDNFAHVSVDSLEIPSVFKNILKRRIDYLLPVQILALNEGLLYNEDLLVVSATASGKTLVAELTGITKALQKRKFVYLSPLVALANQKYRDFKKYYEPLGLRIAIKVGRNRVHASDELVIEDTPIDDADIIVATYEGLDFILRSGQYHSLDDLGVVVIDEIHMIENVERGCRLNGLINRLMKLFPYTQLIGLSATINNPQELADEFNMKLVEYDSRPVTLERHLIFCDSREFKRDIIERLCQKEYENESSKGFKGQTIIFTDSRRKTQVIADDLQKKGVNAVSYHAGLTYKNKIQVEEDFADQKISTVVTTAALAAGVDFPASQVIFDSLRMGNEWLSNNEFFQMIGRAGRPSYHDTGKVYLLPVSGQQLSYVYEEHVALRLLESSVDDINVLFRKTDVYEQILSDISAVESMDLKDLENNYYDYSLPIIFDDAANTLYDCDMIEYNSDSDTHSITRYGRATSMSFISIDEAEYIRNNITKDIIEIIVGLESISNAYLSNSLLKSFKRILNFNVSTRLFSDNTKELITDGYFLDKLSRKHQSQLYDLHHDFILCDCNESPYCHCFEKNVSRHILNRRLAGWSPSEISKEFMRNYSVNIYSGDIFNWLDQVIRYSESIGRIGEALDIPNINSECARFTHIIEFGHE